MMSQVLAALQLLVPSGPIEIRALVAGRMLVQRFATHQPAADFAAKHDVHADTKAVYVVMNPFDATGIESGKGATDAVVSARRWLLIDVDPVRPVDANSSDEELQAATNKARDIEFTLTAKGWPLPVRALSGNGAHLLYRIDLPNDQASKALVDGALRALAAEHDTAAVHVDTSVFNAARITKAYGTISRKGPNVLERPQRRSEIRRVPDPLQVVSREQLAELAAKAPAVPQPVAPRTDYAPGESAYDLRDVLAKVAVRSTEERGGSTWYLIACPWGFEHSTDGGPKETALIVQPDGALAFKCFHSHCSHRRWEDARNHLGIDTKAWKDRDRRKVERPASSPAPVVPPPTREREPGEDDVDQVDQDTEARIAKRITVGDRARRAALAARMDIFAKTGAMPGAIACGLPSLNRMLLGGFRPGKFYVLGGETSRGKTTMLLGWAMDAAPRVSPVPIAMITPEMDADSMDTRALAAKTGFGVEDYRNRPGDTKKQWLAAEMPHNIRASFDASDMNAFVDDERPAMLIVDYAQQAVSYDNERRHTALALLGANCLEIAKRYQIPVILGTQVNVSADREFSVRETRILEHQADAMIFIDIEYGQEDGEGQRTIKSQFLKVAKNRHGGAGRFPIVWEPSLFRFRE